MSAELGAAVVAVQSATDGALWKGVVYGALASFLIAAVVFVLDKTFGDFWYSLSFYRPKHRQKLAGSGRRVYELTGKSKTADKEVDEPLTSLLPPPGVTDGLKYEIKNAEIRTKRNYDADVPPVLSSTGL
jgi:hypothetical protein